MEVKRIFDLLSRLEEKFDKPDIFAAKEHGEWKKISSRLYIENSNFISAALLELGIKAGDKIATITNNRPEWNFLDMGIQQIGAIIVPIYPTISEMDYTYILNHAEIKMVFVGSQELLNKIEHILPKISHIQHIYTFNETNGYKSLDSLIDYGKQHLNLQKLNEIKNAISENEVATIIYTSGTTGNPKGVMLNHKNVVSNFIAVSYIPKFGPKGRALSYLPLCHAYERMLNYMYQYLGISIYYCESMATIVENIKEVSPNMLTTVPRLLEKIFQKINSKGQHLKGFKRKIFVWALKVGAEFDFNKKWNIGYQIQLIIAKKLVFSKWHQALGGNIKIIVSGGASLQPRLARIFWAAGFGVLEGYGLSETSPVISVSNFNKNGVQFGKVGPVLRGGVEVKIAEDGEILVKGPNVMQGYYKDAALTKEVIDSEGWFHTGDLGNLDAFHVLQISGRKKELFKTSFGKYINPSQIENKFKESEYIENIMVVGENQKFAAALLVPDFPEIKEICQENDIKLTSAADMISHPFVKKLIQQEVTKMNNTLGATEQIKKFELIDTEWTPLSGELTPTLKLKRNFINEKYKNLIDKIFQTNEAIL